MPAQTFLPERREDRISWLWSRLTDTFPVTRLIGVAILAVAAVTVGFGLVPGALRPGATAELLFLGALVVLVGLGALLTLLPAYDGRALVAALTLGPVVWTAMVFTWNDHGHVVTPVALAFTGAATAAFCGVRALTLQIALCLGATVVYIGAWTPFTSESIARIAVHWLTVVLFTVGVYLTRRRAERLRAGMAAGSMIDDLTGLPNRRQIQAVSAAVLASALRQGREVYALVIDVDRLGQINSRYGPTAGDEVICGVAEIARRELRPEDLLARIGGEELAAVGLVRSQFEAVRVAERLRLAIRRAQGLADATVSIGVATARPGSGVDPVEWVWNLTAVAEESLAAAKASGRDRVAPARQSGDVLGDALELVTARESSLPPDEAGLEHSLTSAWVTPDMIARAGGSLGVMGAFIGALAYLTYSWGPDGIQLDTVTARTAAVIAAVHALLYVTASLAMLVRPGLFTWLIPVVVFCADILWASAALVIPPANGFLTALPLVVMGAVAAWVLSRELMLTQLALSVPLMFVVARGTGESVLSSVVVALVQGGAVALTSFGLYLLRLYGEQLIARAAESSTVDDVTGLPNRRFFAERAPAVVAGAARLGSPVSVAVVRLESFRRLQERVGYSAADKVLMEMGRVLYRVGRVEDTLVRMEGEDFLVVATREAEEARRDADRAVEAVSGIWVQGDPLQARLGFAVGYPTPGVDGLQWLLALADDAAAKLDRAPATASAR